MLQEIDADIVALQEADKRVGGRGSAVPHELIDSHGIYKPVHLGVRHKRMFEKARQHTDRLLKVNTRNIGWHGNAILVKQHVGVLDCAALELPTLEPRGAVIAELLVDEQPLRIVGMHLDLSGLWRKRQMRAILDAIARRPQKMPTVLMGDTNEWRTAAGCLHEIEPEFHFAPTGPSFHARHPVAAARPDHRPQGPEHRGRRRPHEPRRPARRRTICRSGRGCAPSRRSSACRRRWIDEPIPIASRYLTTVRRATSKPLLLEQAGDRVVAQDLVLGVDQLLIAALTASAAAPSPSAEATPDPKKYFSS